MLHLAAILCLLYRIKQTRNCVGLSCKTQEIYLLVFASRYWDLFLYFVSYYNTGMKVFYLGSCLCIIYLMRVQKPYCMTYDREGDSFQHFLYLIPFALLMTCLMHRDQLPGEPLADVVFNYSVSFSWWLEAVAFVPQIVMLNRVRDIENLTKRFVTCLGLYRFFYILNW